MQTFIKITVQQILSQRIIVRVFIFKFTFTINVFFYWENLMGDEKVQIRGLKRYKDTSDVGTG